MKSNLIRLVKVSLACATMTYFAYAVFSALNVQHKTADPHASFDGTIVTARGLTGRTLLRLPAGSCYLMQFPVTVMSADQLSEDFSGDPATPEDDLQAYDEPVNSPWYVHKRSINRLTTFNCATYAIGDSIGLRQSDWLDTSAQLESNGINPVRVVLDSHYQQRDAISTKGLNWKELDFNDDFQTGDIVSFVDTTRNLDFVHLGKIQKVHGRNLLVSKLGDGPIVQGTIKQTASRYPRMFNEIRVYRRKPKKA